MKMRCKIALLVVGALLIPNSVQALQVKDFPANNTGINSEIINMPLKDNDLVHEEGNVSYIIGKVNNLSTGTKDTSVLISSEGFIRTGFNDLILHIDENTEITDENGNKIDIKEVKEEALVKAYYKKALTKSLPPQSNALKLVILKDDNPYTVDKFLQEKDEVTIDEGQIATICLKENKSTGYNWSYSVDKEDVIELSHETEVEFYNSKKLLGADSEHYWHFKAVKPGKVNVVFKLYRPFEGEDEAIRTYRFQINVSPKKANKNLYYPNKNTVIR
ncbi:protease inhibitor I42 family protein [Haloimpatiens sp. FM7315]|uniref:protease inhibitor I42 family protein n=1 Tax=Haloimpatiens sp. FM7315 TaxID=3298609 RepID=UPI0035A31772